MLKRIIQVLLIILAVIVLVPASFIGYFYLTYKDDTIVKGEAYGFEIGSSYTEVYEVAKALKSRKRIESIHRWPKDKFHFEFSDDELLEASGDNRWTMIVDSDWWNNSITLEFKAGQLIEIRRFRMCCEMP